jgi:iron complex transport system substrate-binding protein
VFPSLRVWRAPRASALLAPPALALRALCALALVALALVALALVALVALACLAACAGEGQPDRRAAASAGPRDSAIVATDDGGRQVRLAGPARRVISLIPSATETLMALGATDRLVGRTRYDVDPALAALPSVGGGIDPSVEAVVALKPDLVLAWENDKRREVPNKLAGLGIPVFTLRTEDTTDVFRNVASLGRLTGRDSAAAAVVARLRAELLDVRRSVAGRPRPAVMYVVFNDPPMTAGPDTFIGELIGVAGGRSVFDDATQLWPNVAMEEIVRRSPDLVVLPVGEFRSNAVSTLRQRAGWRDVAAVRAGRIVTVPANLLSRPGPNVGAAARALRAAFHPDAARPRAAAPRP